VSPTVTKTSVTIRAARNGGVGPRSPPGQPLRVNCIYQTIRILFSFCDHTCSSHLVLTPPVHFSRALQSSKFQVTAKMAATATQKMFDIPKKYKAMVYDKPGAISTKLEELDTPEPGSGDVLVRLWVSFIL